MPAHRLDWLVPLALTAAVAAIYLTALPRAFTYDSKGIVRDHALLAPGSSPWALPLNSYWGNDRSGREYRPATLATYWVEKRVLGFERAWPFAAVNALLHAAVTWLLWLLTRRWTGSAAAAGVAAALFAMHPIATDVVPNLVGRADLLATALALAALLAWERRTADRCGRWTATAIALWLAGVLCKESIAVLPIVAALRDVQRFGRAAPWRSWVAWGIVGVAWLVCRTLVVRDAAPVPVMDLVNPSADAPVAVRWMTAVGVWARYVRLMVWPQWMAVEHAFDQVPVVRSPIDAWFLAGSALLLVTIAAILWTWKHRPIVSIGLTLMLLAWLLVSNVPVVIGTIMADRLMYLPLTGLCMAAGAVAGAARPRRVVVALTVAAAIALGVRSHVRAGAWRDEPTLWAQGVRDAPRNARMLANHAQTVRGNDLDAAEAALRRACAIVEPIDPGQTLAFYSNLGVLLLHRAERAGDSDPAQRAAYLDEVQHWLERARLGETTEGNHYERWRAMQQWLAARGEAVAPRYGDWQLHLNLAAVAQQRGEHERALEELAIAQQIDPSQALIEDSRARSLLALGRASDAAAAMRRAAELEPTNRQRWMDLALFHGNRGDTDAALDAADRVLALGEDEPSRQLLLTIYNTALNNAAARQDAVRMRAIAQIAAERHRIRIDLPDDLETRLNTTPPTPDPPSPE